MSSVSSRSSIDLVVSAGTVNWDNEQPRSEGDNHELMLLMDSKVWMIAHQEVTLAARDYRCNPFENILLGQPTADGNNHARATTICPT